MTVGINEALTLVREAIDKFSHGRLGSVSGCWRTGAYHDTRAGLVRVELVFVPNSRELDRSISGKVSVSRELDIREKGMRQIVEHEVRSVMADMQRELSKLIDSKLAGSRAYTARIVVDPCVPKDKMYILNPATFIYNGETREQVARYFEERAYSFVLDEIQQYKQPTKEAIVNIPETQDQGDFILVTIAVPKDTAAQMQAAATTYGFSPVERLVLAELPAVIELRVGMRYQYDESTYVYEVTQIGETEVVLRRHTANSQGGKGSRLVEKRARVEGDLGSGRATEITES